MKSLYLIFRYLKRHIRSIVLYFFFNLLSVLFSLVSLTMLIPFLLLVFGHANAVHTRPAFSFTSSSVSSLFN